MTTMIVIETMMIMIFSNDTNITTTNNSDNVTVTSNNNNNDIDSNTDTDNDNDTNEIAVTIVKIIMLIRRRITMKPCRFYSNAIWEQETLNQWKLTITLVNMRRFKRDNVHDHKTLWLV